MRNYHSISQSWFKNQEPLRASEQQMAEGRDIIQGEQDGSDPPDSESRRLQNLEVVKNQQRYQGSNSKDASQSEQG